MGGYGFGEVWKATLPAGGSHRKLAGRRQWKPADHALPHVLVPLAQENRPHLASPAGRTSLSVASTERGGPVQCRPVGLSVTA